MLWIEAIRLLGKRTRRAKRTTSTGSCLRPVSAVDPHPLDSRRRLPGGFGEGEQLLIKEGDRRGTKSFGVNNAQRSVLSSELAPEAMMALSGGNIQRHRMVPEAVACNFLRFEQTKTKGAAAAPNRHVRQVNDLAGKVAEAPKPLKETTVLGCRSSRQPCDPADIFGQDCLPERFLLRVNPLPARAAKLILHPVEPRLRVGRIDRPQGQVVEVADNAIVSASVMERLIQASSRRVTEDDLKSGRCHRWPLCECCPLLLMIGGDRRHS